MKAMVSFYKKNFVKNVSALYLGHLSDLHFGQNRIDTFLDS